MNTNPKIDHLQPHKWQKGHPSPNRSGRPKSLKKILSDECNLTPTQSAAAILNLLMHTKCEIEDICNDDTQPMFSRIIAKSLLKNYNSGSLYALESLLNRTHGMPRQQTDITTTQEKPIFVSLDLDVR
jgi:hypothetical protein